MSKITQHPDKLYLYDNNQDNNLTLSVDHDLVNEDINVIIERNQNSDAIKVSAPVAVGETANNHEKRVVFSTNELVMPDRKSTNSLFVPQNNSNQKMSLDEFDAIHQDTDRSVNILQTMSLLQQDIDAAQYDNLVKQVIEEPSVEMNDLAPFNSIKRNDIIDTHGHSGWETVEIPIDPVEINGDFVGRAAETNEALAQTKFISWEQYQDNGVQKINNLYVTINLSTELASGDKDALAAQLVDTSVCKLIKSDNTSLFTDAAAVAASMVSKQTYGLPAPGLIGTENVYDNGATTFSVETRRYMVGWYNFIQKHLVTLNNAALSEHYDIDGSGNLPQVAWDAGNADLFKGWRIIRVSNSSNASTRLLENLKYTDTADWKHSDDHADKTSNGGSFEISLNKLVTDSSSATTRNRLTNATVVPYPLRSYIWENGDQVWVDYHSQTVSDPSPSCDNSTRRHVVTWQLDGGRDVPDTGKYTLVIETGSTEIKLKDSNDVELQNIKFLNQYHFKFDADYDHDAVDTVPMVEISIDVPKTVDTGASQSMYFLNMSRTQEIGNLVHNATKEIGAFRNSVGQSIDAVEGSVSAGEAQQRSAVNVRKAIDANMTSGQDNVNVAINELRGKLQPGQESNAVFLYQAPTESVLMTVNTESLNLETIIQTDKYGYIVSMLAGTTADQVPAQSTLEPRHLVVKSYHHDGAVWSNDTQNVCVNQEEGTGAFNLFDYVSAKPHRVLTDALSEYVTIETQDSSVKVLLLPIIIVQSTDNGVGTTGGGDKQSNISVSFLNEKLLSLDSPVNSSVTVLDDLDDPADANTLECSLSYNKQSDNSHSVSSIVSISGGSSVDQYAMFMNGNADLTKLFASYKISTSLVSNNPPQLTGGAEFLSNDSAIADTQDLVDCMYFLDDVVVGGVSKLTDNAGNIEGDIVSIFNNGGNVLNNITLKVKSYNNVTKAIGSPIEIELHNEMRAFASSTGAAIQQVISDNKLAIDAHSADPVVNNMYTTDSSAWDVNIDWMQTAGADASSTSIYGNLLSLHNDWNGSGAYSASYIQDASNEIAATDAILGITVDPNDYKISLGGSMKLSSVAFTVSDLPTIPADPLNNGVLGQDDRGKLYMDDLSKLSDIVGLFKTKMQEKIVDLYGYLQNGYDDAATADVREQYGYYTLQEYIADVQTVMQSVEQTLFEEWRDVANKNSTDLNESIRSIHNVFSTAMDAAMTAFETYYRTATAKVKAQHAVYMAELQKHENNIHLHNSLSSAMVNIASQNGDGSTVPTTVFTPNALAGNNQFFASSGAWASSVRELYDGSTVWGSQPYDNFTEDLTQDQIYTVVKHAPASRTYYYWLIPDDGNLYSVNNGVTLTRNAKTLTVVGHHRRAKRICVSSSTIIQSGSTETTTAGIVTVYNLADNISLNGTTVTSFNSTAGNYDLDLAETADGSNSFNNSNTDGSGSTYLATLNTGKSSGLEALVWASGTDGIQGTDKVLNLANKQYLLSSTVTNDGQIASLDVTAGFDFKAANTLYETDDTKVDNHATVGDYDNNTFTFVSSTNALASGTVAFVHIIYAELDAAPTVKFNSDVDAATPTTITHDSNKYATYDVSGVTISSIVFNGADQKKYNILVEGTDGSIANAFHRNEIGKFENYVTGSGSDDTYTFATDSNANHTANKLYLATSTSINLNASGDDESTALTAYKGSMSTSSDTDHVVYEMLLSGSTSILTQVNVAGSIKVTDDTVFSGENADKTMPSLSLGNVGASSFEINVADATNANNWIGVWSVEYGTWDEANAANSNGVHNNYHLWLWVDQANYQAVRTGTPESTLTFDTSNLVAGTYNIVMFRDGNEPDVRISNMLQYTQA